MFIQASLFNDTLTHAHYIVLDRNLDLVPVLSFTTAVGEIRGVLWFLPKC